MNDRCGVTGEVTLALAEDGVMQWRRTFRNLILTNGLAEIVASIVGQTNHVPNYFALGTGTTAPAVGQTSLIVGDNLTWRAIAAKSLYTTTIASYETVYTTTQANGTWAEIGMYSGATATAFSGLLFARALINVTKTSSQTLTVSWRVQVS